jgi:molybdopterin synthase sulfur carrier subunit
MSVEVSSPVPPVTVEVSLAPALTRLFPGAASRLEVSATTVGAMIDALDALWPGMHDRLVDSTPRIRRHINVFVDGQRAILATPLNSGAKVFVITAVSGG